MTYAELAERINNKLTNVQRNQDVMVLNQTAEECFPVIDFTGQWDAYGGASRFHRRRIGITIVEGVLDNDHPFLTIMPTLEDET